MGDANGHILAIYVQNLFVVFVVKLHVKNQSSVNSNFGCLKVNLKTIFFDGVSIYYPDRATTSFVFSLKASNMITAKISFTYFWVTITSRTVLRKC